MRLPTLAALVVLNVFGGGATAQPQGLSLASIRTSPGAVYFVPDRTALPPGGFSLPTLLAFDRQGQLVREWDTRTLQEAPEAGELGLDELLSALPVVEGRFPTWTALAHHLETEDGSRPTPLAGDLTLVLMWNPNDPLAAVDEALGSFATAHPGSVTVVRAALNLERYQRRNPGARIEHRRVRPLGGAGN